MRITAKPKNAPAPDAATATYRAEKAKRAAAAPDADAMRAKLAKLRAEEKAVRAEAAKLGVSLKRERALPETPANGALLSIHAEERDGVPVIVAVFAIGDGSLQTRDGRPYAVNVTAPVSVPVNVEGLEGDWATGGLYLVQRQPEEAGK